MSPQLDLFSHWSIHSSLETWPGGCSSLNLLSFLSSGMPAVSRFVGQGQGGDEPTDQQPGWLLAPKSSRFDRFRLKTDGLYYNFILSSSRFVHSQSCSRGVPKSWGSRVTITSSRLETVNQLKPRYVVRFFIKPGLVKHVYWLKLLSCPCLSGRPTPTLFTFSLLIPGRTRRLRSIGLQSQPHARHVRQPIRRSLSPLPGISCW